MNKKILFALICVLFVSSCIPVMAAEKRLTITVVPYERDNPDVEIKEGHGVITDENGSIVKEWDLNGKGVKFDSKTNEVYEVSLEFEDDSKYIDYTYSVVNGATLEDEEQYWEKTYDIGVYTRRILPIVKDSTDSSIIQASIQLCNENGEELNTFSTNWSESNLSFVPGLPTGNYLIRATDLPKGYYDNGFVTVKVPDGPADVAAKIYTDVLVGRQSGALTIKTVNKAGEPVKGVTVTAVNKDTDENVNMVTSDENGEIRLWDLPIGEFKEGQITKWYTYKISVIDVPQEYEAITVEPFEVNFQDYSGENETFIYADKNIVLYSDEESENLPADNSGKTDENNQGETNNNENDNKEAASSPKTGDRTQLLFLVAALEMATYIILKRKQRCI